MFKGYKLKEIREAKGLSAAALGKRVGVDKTTILRYESGEIGKMPYLTFMKLLVILETTPEELLDGEELELVQKSDELRSMFKVMGSVQMEMVREMTALSPSEAEYIRDSLKGLAKLHKQ